MARRVRLGACLARFALGGRHGIGLFAFYGAHRAIGLAVAVAGTVAVVLAVFLRDALLVLRRFALALELALFALLLAQAAQTALHDFGDQLVVLHAARLRDEHQVGVVGREA